MKTKVSKLDFIKKQRIFLNATKMSPWRFFWTLLWKTNWDGIL